jgi:hypothetical protein
LTAAPAEDVLFDEVNNVSRRTVDVDVFKVDESGKSESGFQKLVLSHVPHTDNQKGLEHQVVLEVDI